MPMSDEPTIRVGDVERGRPPDVLWTRHGTIVNDPNGATVGWIDGSTLMLRVDGTVEIMKPGIKRIEVHDLLALARHETQRVMQTTSHHLALADGGRFSYLCDGTGKVIEITSRGVNFQYDPNTGVMRVGTPGHGDKAPAKPLSLRRRMTRWLRRRWNVWRLRRILAKQPPKGILSGLLDHTSPSKSR